MKGYRLGRYEYPERRIEITVLLNSTTEINLDNKEESIKFNKKRKWDRQRLLNQRIIQDLRKLHNLNVSWISPSMSPGNCVTAAERQIRDLGGEAARDYDPHGAISTPSHLNRSLPTHPTG